MEYQSLRVKGSWVLFFRPFLPLDSLLFLVETKRISNWRVRSKHRRDA